MANIKEKRICFGLIGVGRIGRLHFRNLLLNERSVVKYIVEEDVEAAKELLHKYKMEDNVIILRANEIHRIYDDEKVDAVMVCTPSKTHETLVQAALKSGKAVFCEKPLAFTIQGVKECYTEAEKTNKPLFVAFNRRFDPQLNRMWREIREGKIGAVKLVRSTSRDPPGMMTKEYLQTSGGIYIDSVVHDIDMANWLVGEEPESVYATGQAWDPLWRDVGDVDTSAAVIRYPGGAVAMIDVHRNIAAGYDQRVEATGSYGTIQSNNRTAMDLERRTNDEITSTSIHTDFLQRYGTSYQKELDYFLDVIEGKEDSIITKESTLAVNFTAEACNESLRSKKVIYLKDIASQY